MAAAHTLTVALDTSGFAWTFTCPHDGTDADTLPDDERPGCRIGGHCAGRIALISSGGPARLWGGERITLAAVPVQIVRTGTAGVHLEHAPAVDPGPDEAARQLARASGHPRYTETDSSWRRLYEQDANVIHAHRAAARQGADRRAADLWRDVLLAWHQDEARGVSAGADPN